MDIQWNLFNSFGVSHTHHSKKNRSNILFIRSAQTILMVAKCKRSRITIKIKKLSRKGQIDPDIPNPAQFIKLLFVKFVYTIKDSIFFLLFHFWCTHKNFYFFDAYKNIWTDGDRKINNHLILRTSLDLRRCINVNGVKKWILTSSL